MENFGENWVKMEKLERAYQYYNFQNGNIFTNKPEIVESWKTDQHTGKLRNGGKNWKINEICNKKWKIN